MKYVWFDYDIRAWKMLVIWNDARVHGVRDTETQAHTSADAWLQMYREQEAA